MMRVEHELHQRRRGRNIGVGVALALLIVVVFGLTIAKVTGEDFQVPQAEVNSQ